MKFKISKTKFIFSFLQIGLLFLAGSATAEEKKLISLTKVAPDLTPVSDYTGDVWNRSTAFGDPGGKRQQLYDDGVTFDVSITQVVQGVTSGGAANSGGAHYNGLMDYGMTFDTAKLGGWSGGLFVLTAQTSWGNPIQSEAGNISPVNFTAIYPVPFQDDSVLMEYYYMQAFPNKMVLTIGRLNATNFLDRNRFANEPRDQFLNLSLGNNPLWGEFLTFSTYGTLLDIPLTKNFSAALAAWTPDTQPGDYGGEWNDLGIAGMADYKWDLFNNLGGDANLVFAYSTKDTTAIDNPRLVPGLITGNVPTMTDNYFVAFDLEQYIWKPDFAPENQVRTRQFDYQEPGLGFFFRFGWTPEDRNPWNISVSGGVSGRGLIPGRPYDRMGLGVYSLVESGDLRDRAILNRALGTEVGLEAFYNFAITPWLQLSADIQWIASGIEGNDDAVVLGTRLFTRF